MTTTADASSSSSPEPQRTSHFPFGDRDNSGTAAWRRNEEPRGKVPVPMHAHIGGAQADCLIVGKETGTHIELSLKARTYQIWGDPEKVKKAMFRLGKGTSAATQSRLKASSNLANRGNYASAQWTKIHSLTPVERKIQEDKLDAEEDKRRYRRNPLPDEHFGSIGAFLWPKDTTRPNVIFGISCEGLDDIRMEYSCHIIYNHDSGSLQVMGEKPDVLKALIRLRAAFRQAVASQHLSSTVKAYNLHYYAGKDVHERVTLQYGQPTQIIIPPPGLAAAHQQQQKLPRGQGRLYSSRTGSKGYLLHDLAEKVGSQLMHMFGFVRYYRGHITLRIRLGTFHLLNVQESMYNDGCNLEEFQMMMKNPLFDGAITQELGDRDVEAKAWKRMVSTDGFFNTESSFIHKLSDVRPTYTATLTLDTDKYPGYLQLVKSWKDSAGELAVSSGPSWYRLDQGATRFKVLLETCVIDLEDGLSWQFEMQATRPIAIEKLEPDLQDLGTNRFNIKEREVRRMHPQVIWCEFEKNGKQIPRPVNQKKALELRVAWQFGIQNSDYTIEVAKVQNIRYELRSNGEKEAVIFEPRWTVHVVHRGWEENFASNTNIGIGKDATWRADMETWFPPDDDAASGVSSNNHTDDGCVAMMEKLFRIQQILRGREEKAD